MTDPGRDPAADPEGTLARAAARIGVPKPARRRPDGLPAGGELSVPALTVGVDGLPPGRSFDLAVAVAARVTGVEERRLLATWVSGWFVHWALGPTLVAWLDERRVAPLDAEGVAIWWDGEGPVHVRPGRGTWVVLPDDPVAGHPGVDTAANGVALDEMLHARVVGLLDPLIRAFAQHEHVGVRQQWLQARDRIADILQDAGRDAGRESDAMAAAERFLDRAGSPFGALRAGFVPYVVDGRTCHVYHRATCCLALRAPEGQPCLTCPARPRALTPEAIVTSLRADAADAA